MNHSGSPTAENPANTLNRYLLNFQQPAIDADVDSFTGEETLSHPWRYVIRFTSADRDIAPDVVMMKPAVLMMRSPAPGWSRYQPDKSQWETLREVHGVITSLSRLSTSQDESFYEAILEHPLTLLRHSRRYAIYQQISVPELVSNILKSHGMEGYEIEMDGLTWTYPAREMIVQWGETDLAFILRLLSEVGIWFHFKPHEDVSNVTVMVFGDSQSGYVFGHNITALPISGMAGDAPTIRKMRSHVSVIPAAVHTRDYDYRIQRFMTLESTADISREAPFTTGQDYHYADIQHEAGDRWESLRGGTAETSWFYARIRHERHLCGRIRLEALTDDPTLFPGMLTEIKGTCPDAFSPGLVVTSLRSSASRSNGFLAELCGIPYSELSVFRPERLPRPVISGTVPARISGLSVNDTLARPDNQGRYRVKFCFDLEQWDKGRESMPVRLARIYAGDRFGIHFPLLDNTEVAVAFEGGDPERPYIAHVLHDALNPDVVNDSNSTRNVIRTRGRNKLRMEDEKSREHIKLATEYGKSQLNLGHLVDASRKPRGAGVELRTDKHAALRAAEGILLTTSAQIGASGQQLDMAGTIGQLEQALSLAYTLQSSAGSAGADTVATDTQQTMNQALSGLEKPGIIAWGDAGIAQVTPENLQLSAGQDVVVTAGKSGSVNIFKTLSLAAGQGISAFVRRVGIKLIAAAGNITLQAQRGKLAALSDQDMQLTSVNGELQLSAKNGLFLHCGGGGIRIHPNGGVEIFSPTRIEQKSPSLSYQKGETVKIVSSLFQQHSLARQVRLYRDGDRKHPLIHQAFRVNKPDGSVVEGVTDENGHSPLLDIAETEQFAVSLVRSPKL
ncbi:type VI secretion system Vgr family protein [Erwinia typographi]|uniref:type VI secretion system Vgr family protein n=1 Tax=Erwinia typographi TaxID=371042 RepID=UPI00090780BD|nr:type VI secretion system Vgr family protein [Erwinia typographi]